MQTSATVIRQAESSAARHWDAYAAAHANGLAYHFFAWKQAIEAAYGFACPWFYAEQAGRICGLLPMAHVHLPGGRGALVSLPYCDAGGIMADTPEVEGALFHHACRYAEKLKISRIDIRHAPAPSFSGEEEEARQSPETCSGGADGRTFSGKVRLLLDLPEDAGMLLQSFKSKLRSQIRKPQRDGLRAVLGGEELLDVFYAVLAENMRDLGSPVHSRAWFASVLQFFGDRARCGVVFLADDTPAAAGMILCHPGVVSLPWASALQRFNHRNPNMLLYWSFLKFAADSDYRFFDLGRSTPGSGTYRFKRQWGSKVQRLHWEAWQKTGQEWRPKKNMTAAGNGGCGRAAAEGTFRQLPLPAATFLGSRLRKYISL